MTWCAGEPARVRVRLRVRGVVQGVGFRAAARRRAGELGLAGWVRNLPTGEVEAVAEGPEEAVEAFVEFCRRGPTGARVDWLSVAYEPPVGGQGFHVRLD